MSDVIQNNIRGAIRVTDLPDRACFTTWREFVLSLEKYLAVEVPENISGVIFSRSEPGESERDKIWVRRESNGEIVGIYLFNVGSWEPFYAFINNEFKWLWGDSLNIPKGLKVILVGDVVVPPNVVLDLMSQYVPNGAGYSKFAVRRV